MAFEGNVLEEDLDYENDGNGSRLNEVELLDEEDDYEEDLYGDVNVGVYGAQPSRRNAPQNGYEEMDSGNEDEEVLGESKGALGGEARDAKLMSMRHAMAASARPPQESVGYQHDYIPQVKEENSHGDPEADPSLLKPKDEFEQGMPLAGRPAPVPKGGKNTGILNGNGGAEGGAGRGPRSEGFHPGGWPAGSGPAGRGFSHSCYRLSSFPCLVRVVF